MPALKSMRVKGVGNAQEPSEGTLEEHLGALNRGAKVIEQLVLYRHNNRQLQSLYSGVGYTGLERFLHEPDGSLCARTQREFYDEDIIGSLERVSGVERPQSPPVVKKTKKPPSEGSYTIVDIDSSTSNSK